MLRESFIFLPGVQEKTERMLWEKGIATWEHLLDAAAIPGVGSARLQFWKSRVRQMQELISAGENLRHLKRMFGSRWSWRLMKEIMESPRFVDIETTEYANDITVLGVSDGQFYQGFVKGRNLDRASLERAFAGCTCLVTFNGSSFDLPIIARRFPGVLPDVPHLDLRHICAQAGYRGGLKRIEKTLQIQRADNIRDADGTDAILLWYRHLMGDESALQELVDYNAADCLNLQPLLELVVPALWKHVRYGQAVEVLQRT